MQQPIDHTITQLLKEKIKAIEKELSTNILTYHGPIVDGNEVHFLEIVEELFENTANKNSISIFLTTPGGSALAVERYVNIIRAKFKEVNFIVPDHAYSAGTIFCMSGDFIYMDYFSVLGPIDPQVKNREGKFVPALGYLDKINELIEKAKSNEITDAEFIILKDFDLAELRNYEQAKELTVELLKKWLVKYKFKNWVKHETTPQFIGQDVTEDQKIERAEFIADKLSNNNIWKSHARPINIETLKDELKLKIEDYSDKTELRNKIRDYYELLSDFVKRNPNGILVQTRFR